jgi:hypothetical protein
VLPGQTVRLTGRVGVGRHTGDADPRESPTLPVRFPEKEDAEAIAARIEAAIRDCAAEEPAA